jgi:hypothetical protein
LESYQIEALKRDGHRCVVTNTVASSLNVCHIVPHSLRDDVRGGPFWATLAMFWPKEKIDAWYHAIFDSEEGTEVVQNLICLNASLHGQWGHAEFALEPVRLSDDKRELVMKWWWMKKPSTVRGEMPISWSPPLNLMETEHDEFSTGVSRVPSGTYVKSGDTIIMRTDDPTIRPLPDVRLLEIQFLMQRLSAIRGGSEEEYELSDDSDDDEEEEAILETTMTGHAQSYQHQTGK